MNMRRLPSLVVALFLQLAPLVRTVEPVMAGVLQPVFLLLRWVSAAGAVAGGAHALSGATGLLSPNTVRGTNGVSLSYRAEIFSDQYGTPAAYTATGLPPGLRVTVRSAGIISGVPTSSGTFRASVTGWKTSTATGDNRYTATVTFTIVDGVPVITTPPVPKTVAVGETVTLSVAATGTSLSYRWLKGDLEVPGGTGPDLTFSPVKLSDAGEYRVRVQNSGGSVLSDPVLLTVNPAAQPPTFTAVPAGRTVHEGETVAFTAAATAGQVPASVSWLFGGAPAAGGGAATLTLPQVTAAAQGEYRAVATANGLSTTSGPVSLTVVAPLRASGVAVRADRLAVNAPAINGRRYFLESRVDPTTGDWVPVSEAVAAAGAVEVSDPDLGAPVKIYRLRVE